MSIGLVARKVGMTRIFADDGFAIPVTVLDVASNRIAQIKNKDRDGYGAIQVAFGTRRAKRITKAEAGHYAAAGIEAAQTLREFRVSEEQLSSLSVGVSLAATVFHVGQKVDITGKSQGKGFSGPIKRHNFSSNRASHGNSVSHNTPGSISMAQDPGRVFPGKRMAGQYGAVTRTQQNLEVVRVDHERQLILIKGSVPGARGSKVVIRPAIKEAG